MAVIDGPESAIPERISALLEEWKRRLIDLTRRNRLLFFRPLRSASVRVEAPIFREAFSRLVIEEKPWRFYLPLSELAEDLQPGPIQDDAEAASVSAGQVGATAELRPRSNDELLLAGRDEKALVNSLKNLFRRSRTDYEERGIRILYLAVGMLRWREVPQSDEIASPLLLVPCELKRDSPRDPFQLVLADDDIVGNPSLDARLRSDFRIDLPPAPEDWESTADLDSYLEAVRALVEPRGWRVEDECWLSLFSFHKLVMYRDLDAHQATIASHSLIAALGGTPGSPGFGADLPDPTQLDSTVAPTDSFLVLDADSSQLAAIEGAKRGGHLVVQGPPGTGKSQTITNLIAEALAQGKSVLFVSEKMAALEVVYKRLLAANLGQYCLELHSHNAKKREVVAELYRTYRSALVPRRVMSDEELDRLRARREQLNDYVLRLHLIRQPLGRSVFDVLGELSTLEPSPLLAETGVRAESVTVGTLRASNELVRRLAAVWDIVREGEAFPWYASVAQSFGPETKARYTALLQRLDSSTREVQQLSADLSVVLGITAPEKAVDARGLLALSELLARSPGVERDWLRPQRMLELQQEAAKLREFQTRWRLLDQQLNDCYELARLRAIGLTRAALQGPWVVVREGLPEHQHLDSSQREQVLAWLRDFLLRSPSWMEGGARLGDALGMRETLSVDELGRRLAVAALVEAAIDRPEASWFENDVLGDVERSGGAFEAHVLARIAQRTALLERYDERFFNGVEDLADEWTARYVTWARWFKRSYYRRRSELRQMSRDGRVQKTVLTDLRQGADLARLDQRLQADFPRLEALLGRWFHGLDTDFAGLRRAAALVREVRALVAQPSPELMGWCTTPNAPHYSLRDISAPLRRSLDDWEEQARPARIPVESIPRIRLPLRRANLGATIAWANAVVADLARVHGCLGQLAVIQRSNDERSIEDCIRDLGQLEELEEVERAINAERDRLASLFGSRYAALNTDLADLRIALDFASELLATAPEISDEVARIAAAGGHSAPNATSLRSAIEMHASSAQDVEALFAPGAGPQRERDRLSEAEYPAIIALVSVMQHRLDEVRDWIELSEVTKGLEGLGLGSLQSSLNRVQSASELAGTARRSILSAWIEWVYAQEPSLALFRSQNHEALIADFRDLDVSHHQLGAQRVIRNLESMRPGIGTARPGGEVALLEREAAKKKRHLPLRKLFTQMPMLLRTLKPCLLMSPMSVSQFLDSEANRFDLVVFDEASQMPTHDAVCAIYRGHQLIVCGDNKQLPPTSFFEESESLDEESDVAEGHAFDVFESVLDECRSVGVPIQWLDWHYRSKHESLIAFSNRSFYEDRLFTFPSAADKSPVLGVQFLHVPEGVYDRGGTKQNAREADFIVELVADHFLRTPARSLGVVAFSVAQERAIEDRLELYRKQHPEMERFFASDPLEGFFIKNLERVQGDERDVIIFSVGYGRDSKGEFKMWFGPLNLAGGERRLNVAVTRAREQVKVVSSVRAADFDLRGTSAPGVLALHRYLDYAERGMDALQTPMGVLGGESESPLEQSVASAIRELGYDVVHQVGCGKYRVDIGVVDPADPGRFLLGVECDGAMYHSAYTARDRDRIRQEVLERLGWTIHRVWSPDWATRRQLEVERLSAALQQARTEFKARPIPAPLLMPSPEPAIVRESLGQTAQLLGRPEWARPYEIAPAGRFSTTAEIVKQVVEIEGPVHRDVLYRRATTNMGWQRAGVNIKYAIETAVRVLLRNGSVVRKGDFLWRARQDFELTVRYPTGPDSERRINQISEEELQLALRLIAAEAMSLTEDGLLTQAARVLGFERRGHLVDDGLRAALSAAIGQGHLRRIGDRIGP